MLNNSIKLIDLPIGVHYNDKLTELNTNQSEKEDPTLKHQESVVLCNFIIIHFTYNIRYCSNM